MQAAIFWGNDIKDKGTLFLWNQGWRPNTTIWFAAVRSQCAHSKPREKGWNMEWLLISFSIAVIPSSPDNCNKWFWFYFMNSEEGITLVTILCFPFFLSYCWKMGGKESDPEKCKQYNWYKWIFVLHAVVLKICFHSYWISGWLHRLLKYSYESHCWCHSLRDFIISFSFLRFVSDSVTC